MKSVISSCSWLLSLKIYRFHNNRTNNNEQKGLIPIIKPYIIVSLRWPIARSSRSIVVLDEKTKKKLLGDKYTLGFLGRHRSISINQVLELLHRLPPYGHIITSLCISAKLTLSATTSCLQRLFTKSSPGFVRLHRNPNTIWSNTFVWPLQILTALVLITLQL